MSVSVISVVSCSNFRPAMSPSVDSSGLMNADTDNIGPLVDAVGERIIVKLTSAEV
jgi:hypothetical protein